MPNLFSNLLTNSFINRKCQNISNSNSSRDFWHLANNISNNFTSSFFPPLLQSNGSTAVSSFSKAELFTQTFANNSTLDDTGHIPPTPPSSDNFIPKIKILYYDVFNAFSGVDSRKAYGPDGVTPVVLKNCASELAHSLPDRTLSSVYLFFLLETCSLSICPYKRVTTPIFQTTAL